MRNETEIVEAFLRAEFGVPEGAMRVERHIADGAYVATLLTIESDAGPFSAFVCCRLAGGRVEEARVFQRAKGGKS